MRLFKTSMKNNFLALANFLLTASQLSAASPSHAHAHAHTELLALFSETLTYFCVCFVAWIA